MASGAAFVAINSAVIVIPSWASPAAVASCRGVVSSSGRVLGRERRATSPLQCHLLDAQPTLGRLEIPLLHGVRERRGDPLVDAAPAHIACLGCETGNLEASTPQMPVRSLPRRSPFTQAP